MTCAASSASAGTTVAAVAPEPITTTRLPDTSSPSGQVCGCTISPRNSASPGRSGVCPSSCRQQPWHIHRNPAVKATRAPSSSRSASTVQRAASDDQRVAGTRWP